MVGFNPKLVYQFFQLTTTSSRLGILRSHLPSSKFSAHDALCLPSAGAGKGKSKGSHHLGPAILHLTLKLLTKVLFPFWEHVREWYEALCC